MEVIVDVAEGDETISCQLFGRLCLGHFGGEIGASFCVRDGNGKFGTGHAEGCWWCFSSRTSTMVKRASNCSLVLRAKMGHFSVPGMSSLSWVKELASVVDAEGESFRAVEECAEFVAELGVE